jgi:hypothetical protein
MTRARKRAVWIGGLLVVASPFLFLLFEHFRCKVVLAHYKQSLVARGEKLTIFECMPAASGPGENGFGDLSSAMAKVASAAIAENAPSALLSVAPGKVWIVRDLKEWPKSFSRNETNRCTWQMVEEGLDASREPLEEARVAIHKPHINGPVNYSLVNFTLMPGLMTTRRAGQCFNASALVNLERGQFPGAVIDIATQLRLGQGVREDVMILNQLVSYAITTMALGPTWQALQQPNPTEAALLQLQQAWETNDFFGPALRALEMERAMYIDALQQGRESGAIAAKVVAGASDSGVGTAGGTQSLDDLTQDFGEKSTQLLTRGLFIPLWQFTWSYEDERNHLEVIQTVLDAGRKAQREQSIRPVRSAIEALGRTREHQTGYDRLRHVTSNQAADVFGHFLERVAQLQAQRALAVTAIALKRYQLRTGHPPPNLAALTPDFLKAVPLDIFDGEPLRYRIREDGSFLLYSIGKDSVDNGGDPAPPTKGGFVSFQNGRDFVWPQRATVQEIEEAEAKLNGKRVPPGRPAAKSP